MYKMSILNQLILGKTGCVSYVIYCSTKRECAIVDSFDGFEEDIHEEIRRLGYPSVKYVIDTCLLYTSPSPRDVEESRMPSSA